MLNDGQRVGNSKKLPGASKTVADGTHHHRLHPAAHRPQPPLLRQVFHNNKQTTYTAYGMAYGLLAADMVERFLLHWFGMSAHTYTRGTWTTVRC